MIALDIEYWGLTPTSLLPNCKSLGNFLHLTELQFFVYKTKIISTTSCPTLLEPHGLKPTRLLCPWDFPREEHWSGLPFSSPRIFLTQGLNLHLLHCRWICYCSATGETQTSYHRGWLKRQTVTIQVKQIHVKSMWCYYQHPWNIVCL